MSKTLFLGVNIDHIATVRNARGTVYPDPVEAACMAEEAGADGITLHLREDRRHILDQDVFRMRDAISTRMNLEMAVTDEMLAIAKKVKPEHVCLVPEKRHEVTTEGGLDVIGHFDSVKQACTALVESDIEVSIFIDPDIQQVRKAIEAGAPTIELHTGAYADASTVDAEQVELQKIKEAAYFASDQGLKVNAGHGLHYENVKPIAAIECLWELNIGHSIIAKSLFIGLPQAVNDMKTLINSAR